MRTTDGKLSGFKGICKKWNLCANFCWCKFGLLRPKGEQSVPSLLPFWGLEGENVLWQKTCPKVPVYDRGKGGDQKLFRQWQWRWLWQVRFSLFELKHWALSLLMVDKFSADGQCVNCAVTEMEIHHGLAVDKIRSRRRPGC